ncbi:MAG: sodium:proton antiporter [Acetobacteraceae bacterium]|nr:sodium:proton antiporter [Acetobacteraceae bacterium]
MSQNPQANARPCRKPSARRSPSEARTLLAIPARSAFFGALPRSDNSPTVMVRAIASRRGVGMPCFFGFCARSFTPDAAPLGLVTLLFFV